MRAKDTDAIAHPWAKRQARHLERAQVTTRYMLGTLSGQLKGFCPSPQRRRFANDGLHGRGLNTTNNFLVQSRVLRGARIDCSQTIRSGQVARATSMTSQRDSAWWRGRAQEDETIEPRNTRKRTMPRQGAKK